MQKIEIRSFTDKDFRKEYGIPLELSVDPEQISFGKNIFIVRTSSLEVPEVT